MDPVGSGAGCENPCVRRMSVLRCLLKGNGRACVSGAKPSQEQNSMAIIPQPSLFSWKQIEARSDVDRLRMVLSVLPDEQLMQALEAHRANGRDDYPVRSTWNTVIAGVVFQHPGIESLRRELSRNGELRQACGLNLALGVAAVPSKDAYTSFLENLMEHQAVIDAMFHDLVERLSLVLPDLGKRLAVDSKAIPSFARGPGKEEAEEGDGSQGGVPEERDPDRRGDPDADWGTKTYRGKRKDGSLWEKTTRWFGFKLHLLVDSTHELPTGYRLTRASAADVSELLPMVADAAAEHPTLLARTEELAGDKAYDSGDVHQELYDELRIRGVIDIRQLWKGTEETRLLDPKKVDNVVYDERGNVYCVCPASDQRRKMAFCGLEPDRDGLKYRCPAAAYGFPCKGREDCPGARTAYGRIVRIPLNLDRRIFTPLARSSKAWQTAYDRRTAVERVNSRLDQVLGFERHTIRGMAKMRLRVSLALVVMLAMALGWIQAGHPERMRSLVGHLPPERLAA